MKVTALLALLITLASSPVWAADSSDTKASTTTPRTAAKLYSAWKANQRKNFDLAFKDGKDFVASYPKDHRAAQVKKWIAANEKTMALKNARQLAISVAPAMVVIPGKNYEMGKYEVTQAEWRALMNSNPSKYASCGDSCPVGMVSWNDAQAFIQKLNAKTGRVYRLPTEAEWEYACYGGSKTEYCGAKNIDSVAWYNGNSDNLPHPAGQKKANGYGLYDMSGNVWEWTNDCWEGDCTNRVLRGGSWLNEKRLVVASFRNRNEITYRYLSSGFRLARSLP